MATTASAAPSWTPASSGSVPRAPTPGTPAASASRAGRIADVTGWARAHPDLAMVGLLLVVGGLMRLSFGLRAPVLFVGGDSQTYLMPAYDLVNGLGFAPILKRPPLYPLFVAGASALLGEDPHGLALLQHVLGLVTVVLTYFLGRAAFGHAAELGGDGGAGLGGGRAVGLVGGHAGGRAAGLVAGLLVALNGPLIVYERYVMAETLMTTLLTAAALALVLGMRRASWRLYALGGALLALASLSRAAAQLLLPLVPLVALIWHRRIGMAARMSGVTLGGFALLAGPWMLLTYVQTGSPGASGLGEALFWRGTRETPVLISREIGRPAEVADPERQAARRFAYQRASQESELPSDTAVLLQERFGLTEAQADRVLREVAVELFARQGGLYVQTSLGLFGELLVGTEQWLGGQGKGGGVRRWPNPAEKYDDWWNEKVRHLAVPPTAAQVNEFRRAQGIANFFQPFRYPWLLLPLLACGVLAAGVVPHWRAALVPALFGLWLLLTTAFLSGALPRYRYPADPLLAVSIGGGVAALGLGAARLVRMTRRPATAPGRAAAPGSSTVATPSR